MATTRPNRRLLGLVSAFALVALATSCGGGSNEETSAPSTVTEPSFDPADFDAPAKGDNKWLPLQPGYQTVRLGQVTRGHRRLEHRVVTTVTNVTKVIDGVRTVIVLDQDIDGGEIAEQALDYMAQDEQGNVWYFGSYTESYEGGQFVNAEDAWLAGVKGSKPGILMPADPKTGTPPYYQAQTPDEEPFAEVVKTGQKQCVPFKCYTNVIVIEENGDEYKYFAAGVGGILTEPRSKGGEQETEELINLTQLSPTGLAELSAEALRLDENARVEAKDVFGDSSAAERTL